jgi:hypothetical protein
VFGFLPLWLAQLLAGLVTVAVSLHLAPTPLLVSQYFPIAQDAVPPHMHITVRATVPSWFAQNGWAMQQSAVTEPLTLHTACRDAESVAVEVSLTQYWPLLQVEDAQVQSASFAMSFAVNPAVFGQASKAAEYADVKHRVWSSVPAALQ